MLGILFFLNFKVIKKFVVHMNMRLQQKYQQYQTKEGTIIWLRGWRFEAIATLVKKVDISRGRND